MLYINNLSIANAVVSDSRIVIKKSFLGLSEKLVYTPTQSTVKLFRKEYTDKVGKSIEATLTMPLEQIEKNADKTHFEEVYTGSYMVEGCISTDHQYAALAVYKYDKLQFNPVFETKCYEGKEAERIAELFS